MFDVMADWLTVPLLQYEGGKAPKRVGLAHPSIAPYGAFTCGDGQQVLIAIQSDREWAKLASEVLHRPELAQHPDFSTNVRRVQNRAATDAAVGGALATLSLEEAVRRLDAADIAFATVNDMEGLSHHPHLRRVTVETPGGRVSYPAPAPMVAGEQRRYGPVPALPSDGS